MIMNNIKEVIKEEKNKNIKLLDKYLKLKEKTPKGSLEIKEIKGEKYIYLKYREKEKIISKYCGKEKENLELIENVQKRKHIDKMIKRIKREIDYIERIEKYANISWK